MVFGEELMSALDVTPENGAVKFYWFANGRLIADQPDLISQQYEHTRYVELGEAKWREDWTMESNCNHAMRIAAQRYRKKLS